MWRCGRGEGCHYPHRDGSEREGVAAKACLAIRVKLALRIALLIEKRRRNCRAQGGGGKEEGLSNLGVL